MFSCCDMTYSHRKTVYGRICWEVMFSVKSLTDFDDIFQEMSATGSGTTDNILWLIQHGACPTNRKIKSHRCRQAYFSIGLSQCEKITSRLLLPKLPRFSGLSLYSFFFFLKSVGYVQKALIVRQKRCNKVHLK